MEEAASYDLQLEQSKKAILKSKQARSLHNSACLSAASPSPQPEALSLLPNFTLPKLFKELFKEEEENSYSNRKQPQITRFLSGDSSPRSMNERVDSMLSRSVWLRA